jgi:ribosome-associated translation inhibitor RaiA
LLSDRSFGIVFLTIFEGTAMQIHVHTDHTIHGTEELTTDVQTTITGALSRFTNYLTRVEAHLSDENGHKSGGDDIKCVIEVRPTGRQPIAVTHHAPNVSLAVRGASDKMKSTLATTYDKLTDHR